MQEILYTLLGVGASGLIFFLFKLFGGKKGQGVIQLDTDRASKALDTATKLLGKRAAVETKDDTDKRRVEEKLKIEDPVERVEALAEELKDL